MTHHDLGAMKGLFGWHFFARAAVAALVVLGGSALGYAQALTYVDAVDWSYGYGAGGANIFHSDGSQMTDSSELDPFGAAEGDGVWGWRSFGVPSGGFATVYESAGEDDHEVQVVLDDADPGYDLPAGDYDVYVVYWGDRAANWTIRAGTSSGGGMPGSDPDGGGAGQVASTLQLYDVDGGDDAIAGTLASAAAWTTLPANNPDTETDDNPSPFVDHTPGADEPFTRDMYLGKINFDDTPITRDGTGKIRIWIDDFPDMDGNGQRAWIEGLAFVPAGNEVFTTASLDRDTGNLTINNPTSVPFDIARIELVSEAGSLDGTVWNTVTDGDTGVPTDTDDDWQLVAFNEGTGEWESAGAPSASELSMAEQDEGFFPIPPADPQSGSQDGVTFDTTGAGQTWDFGNVWRRTPYEDIQVRLTSTAGNVLVIEPEYLGGTITAGDFDADGDIDSADYLALIGGLHVDHATDALAFAAGDITLNGTVDRNDVVDFKFAFEGMNGAGSFGAMLASLSVPEPSSAVLAVLACGLVALVRRRRRVDDSPANAEVPRMMHRRRTTPWIVVFAVGVLAGGLLVRPAAAQTEVVDWNCDLITTPGGCNITEPDTNHPTFGNGSEDDLANVHAWANMPVPVNLNNGEELVLSGQMNITGIDGNEAAGFRWGFFYDGWDNYNTDWALLDPVPTNPTVPAERDQPTIGWTGYIANNSAGGPNGRLEAKNTDKNNFETRSSISTFGGERAFKSGPCDNGMTPDPDGCGASVFYLADATGPNDDFIDGNYEFSFVLGRYGEEVDVRAELHALDAENPYDLVLGGGLDYEGRFPAGNDADGNPVVPRPHTTFTFDRVSLFFASSVLQADQAVMQDILVTPRPVESLTLEIDLADNGAGRFVNNSDADFDMVYYDITSDTGSLTQSTWDEFDSTPDDPPDGVGWNVAGGSSDFVLSEINLSAGAVVGDYNGDGTVDAADYTVWRDAAEAGAMTLTNRDPANSGLIDEDDYTSWRNNFGATGGGGGDAMEFPMGGEGAEIGNIFDTSGGTQDLRFFFITSEGSLFRGIVEYINGAGAGATAVPEPGTLWLLSLGAIWTIGRRRSARRRSTANSRVQV